MNTNQKYHLLNKLQFNRNILLKVIDYNTERYDCNICKINYHRKGSYGVSTKKRIENHLKSKKHLLLKNKSYKLTKDRRFECNICHKILKTCSSSHINKCKLRRK